MSDSEDPDPRAARETFAESFDRSADPLEQYSDRFESIDADPFDYYIRTVVENRESVTSDTTLRSYDRTYDQWREYMATSGRHPACPSIEHVQGFIEWRRDDHGNSKRTIAAKLNRLSQVYQFWQSDSVFPHPDDFNPFKLAKSTTDLGDERDKSFYDLSLEELREKFAEIEHIRSRAIIGLQLKLGLRAGEVCNLELQDLHLTSSDLQANYPDMGTHPALGDHEDVVYISHTRDGNKSSNPRLLPIDKELRWLLLRYLLIRPAVDDPWLFLSERYTQLTPHTVNRVWKNEFHPEYAETEDRRAITSHFGRHWFSSYWRLQQSMNREHLQYMRGDSVQPIESFPDAIDDYIHPQYNHIEEKYRSGIFRFNLPTGGRESRVLNRV